MSDVERCPRHVCDYHTMNGCPFCPKKEIVDAERRGFEAAREAAARMCLDAFHHKAPFWLAKSDSENAAAGIRTIEPPEPHINQDDPRSRKR